MSLPQDSQRTLHGVIRDASVDVYTFGPVRVDVARHAVSRDGRPLSLAPKTFELLLILLRSGGRVLSRQELLHALWPDTFVEEANLSFQISTLRKALGEGADLWIETVPKIGYRFTPATRHDDRRERTDVAPDEPSSVGDATSPEVSRRRQGTRAGLLAAGVLAGVTIGMAGMWLVRPGAPGVSVTRLSLDVAPAEELRAGNVPPSAGFTPAGSRTSLAWTADGRTLVYVGRRGGVQQIYVRRLDEAAARPLANTAGAHSLAVSTDGRWVAFWAAGSLRKVPLSGGPAMDVAKVADSPFGLAWDDAGRLFFGMFGDGRIWQVSPEGTVTPVTTLRDGELSHVLPSPLPGGNAILYTVRRRLWTWGDEHIVAHVLASGQRKRIVPDGADARYVRTGHLVFLRRGTLFAAPFNAGQLEILGPAVGVLDGVVQALTGTNSLDVTGAGQFAISSTGTVAVISGPAVPYPDATLVSLDRTGHVAARPAPLRAYGPTLRLSPDGRHVALQVRGLVEQGLWLYETDRGMLSLLAGRGEAGIPRWSPDGRRIAYSWIADGIRSLALQPADGSGPPAVLLKGRYDPSSWTRDGSQVAAVRRPGEDVVIVSAADGRVSAEPLGRTPHREWWPEFSPDGRWLAYGSDVSGRFEVYVRPYPGPGGPHQVSIDGGQSPAWHPRGQELFFVGPPDETGRLSLSAADVDTQSSLRVSRPRTLFRFDRSQITIHCVVARCFDISPDGQLFYATQLRPRPPAPPVTHISLITNWFEELRATVPSPR